MCVHLECSNAAMLLGCLGGAKKEAHATWATLDLHGFVRYVPILQTGTRASPCKIIRFGGAHRHDFVARHVEDVGRRWKTLLEDVGKPRKNAWKT